MPELRFTRGSERDLVEIRTYIARDNPIAAKSFVEKLIRVCELIASSPQMGRERQELANGLRCHPVERYMIYYRITGPAVEVVRVVHSARDAGALLK